MAIPTTMTAALIVTEALKKAGFSNPNSTLITRGTDYWLEEIKNDISQRKGWKLFESTKVLIPTAYNQRIQDPTDYEKMTEVTLYNGGTKGTMQVASANTITLAAGDGSNAHLGRPIFMTSGNAIREMSRVTAISGDVVTVTPAWATQPTSGEYMIADIELDMHYIPNEPLRIVAPVGIPRRVSYYEGEFYLDPVPNLSTYAIVMRFLVEISQIDLTETRYTDILTKWRTSFDAGIYMKALQGRNDRVFKDAVSLYEIAVSRLMKQDSRSRRQRNNSFAMTIGGLPR